jgi:mono/diheme cytochrome c family protein
MMNRKGEILDDETIDTLVYYHIRAHTLITSERLELESQILGLPSAGLFVQKCSTCHSLEKALGTIKDKESWQKTILAMAKKTEDRITHDQVVELINFHMERQDEERELFLRNCTKCHGEDVAIDTPTMTYEQWRETAVSMMERARKPIDKEKLDILANYHSRYEKTMRSLSEKKCTRCHDSERILTTTGTQEAWQRIIVGMSEKEASDITHTDVKRLVRYHVGRQKIEQEIFTKNCGNCHQTDETVKVKKSRDEWRETIRQMMAKTDRMISDEEVEILMSFHIRRFR